MKPSDENSDSDGEDEFFNCSSDVESGDEMPQKKAVKHAPWDQPTGRLSRHGELRLLETGEDLYIPVLQDPIPKTEDQCEEDAELLLQLGTEANSPELKARLMSPPLLSDMEAFKAANPDCILEDFIRWYSPRDWIEDEGVDEFGITKGHLSQRMQIPGNTWLELWKVAKPVPVKRQRRLFNDTKESENVLSFLETTNPCELLLPVITTCVLSKLIEESSVDNIPQVSEAIDKLLTKAERLSWMPKAMTIRYEDLVNEICLIETYLTKVSSLKQKFIKSLQEEGENANYPELLKFITNVLIQTQVEVPGGPRSGIGTVIRSYFAEASKAEQLIPDQTGLLTDEKWNPHTTFPTPCEKEMILRSNSTNGPQRLHAILRKNECRLCGAFTVQDKFL